MKSTQIDLNRYLLHQMPLATALVDTSFTVVETSKTWNTTFQVDSDDISSKPIFSFFEGHEGYSPDLLKEFLIGTDIRTIRHSVLKEGYPKWLESTFSPWYDEQENIQGTIVQTIDIGREIHKDVELEQTRELFQATREISQIGSWEYSLETEQLSWCSMTKQIHEVPENYIET